MNPKTDLHRWDESWHQETSTAVKLLYAYIWDKADDIGAWRIDLFAVGKALNLGIEDDDLQILVDAGVAERLSVGDAEFIWIKRYCDQYATLSDRFAGHRMAIRLIRFYGLFDRPLIKSLFRDGYQYTVDKQRKRLQLDVNDKESKGEREMFNLLTKHYIPTTWQEWRSLCQLCPKLNKKQVIESLIEIIPVYLPSHLTNVKRKLPHSHSENLWKMTVDIAEYSEKGIEYTGAMAESLISSWTEERLGKWQKNKKEA